MIKTLNRGTLNLMKRFPQVSSIVDESLAGWKIDELNYEEAIELNLSVQREITKGAKQMSQKDFQDQHNRSMQAYYDSCQITGEEFKTN